jgi:excisionase family DNA binding protein
MSAVPLLPSPEDVQRARLSGQKLAALAATGNPLTIQVESAGTPSIELPAPAVHLLMKILEDMAAGRAVTIVPVKAELTTQQAADFLNVSRPFLIDLLESRKLPFRLVGTHRRIRFEDLTRYKESIDRDRREVLDELAAESQRLGLGY